MIADAYIEKLKRLSPLKMRETLYNNWETVKQEIIKADKEKEFLSLVNRYFKTSFSSINQLDIASTKFVKESENLDEGKLAKFWKTLSDGFFSKIKIDNNLLNTMIKFLKTISIVLAKKTTAVYLILWLLLVVERIKVLKAGGEPEDYVDMTLSKLPWLKKRDKETDTYGLMFKADKIVEKYI